MNSITLNAYADKKSIKEKTCKRSICDRKSQLSGIRTEPLNERDPLVPGEVVEVVHDDGNEEVEDQEGAHDEEGNEERIRYKGSASTLLSSIIRIRITDCLLTVNTLKGQYAKFQVKDGNARFTTIPFKALSDQV